MAPADGAGAPACVIAGDGGTLFVELDEGGMTRCRLGPVQRRDAADMAMVCSSRNKSAWRPRKKAIRPAVQTLQFQTYVQLLFRPANV